MIYCGHSGAGKTTLVEPACRFYDVSRGAIRIDAGIRDLSMEEIRQQIGIVLQDAIFVPWDRWRETSPTAGPMPRREIFRRRKAANAPVSSRNLPEGYIRLW